MQVQASVFHCWLKFDHRTRQRYIIIFSHFIWTSPMYSFSKYLIWKGTFLIVDNLVEEYFCFHLCSQFDFLYWSSYRLVKEILVLLTMMGYFLILLLFLVMKNRQKKMSWGCCHSFTVELKVSMTPMRGGFFSEDSKKMVWWQSGMYYAFGKRVEPLCHVLEEDHCLD